MSVNVASLSNSLHARAHRMFGISDIPIITLKLHPSGNFLFFNQRKQNGKSWQAFHRSANKDQIFNFFVIKTFSRSSGRPFLARISPKRAYHLLTLDPSRFPATWGLCSVINFWHLSVAGTATGLLSLETLSGSDIMGVCLGCFVKGVLPSFGLCLCCCLYSK